MTPRYIAAHVPQVTGYTPYSRSLRPESSYHLKPLEGWELTFLGLDGP
jgi:hypothetical protein